MENKDQEFIEGMLESQKKHWLLWLAHEDFELKLSSILLKRFHSFVFGIILTFWLFGLLQWKGSRAASWSSSIGLSSYKQVTNVCLVIKKIILWIQRVKMSFLLRLNDLSFRDRVLHIRQVWARSGIKMALLARGWSTGCGSGPNWWQCF